MYRVTIEVSEADLRDIAEIREFCGRQIELASKAGGALAGGALAGPLTSGVIASIGKRYARVSELLGRMLPPAKKKIGIE